jgi:pyruvate ferredoxin oxidoreductase delta subunit
MINKKFITPFANEGLYILDTASWREERPVMNKDVCTECGICMTVCPVNSIKGDQNKTYHISYDFCKGCGVCAYECPIHAIDMVEEGVGV